MPYTFKERLERVWNAFLGRDPTDDWNDIGSGSAYRPDRLRLTYGTERSIISSIYTRIATDVSMVSLMHARLDQNGRYLETIDSTFNECLTLEANIDQSGTAFIVDIVMSMLDEGCVAIVPTDTSFNPNISDSYNIITMRTGKIIEWFPQHVRVELYNERTGLRQQIIIRKKDVAIIENPFYAVMNETNSTLKRLISKLNILDAIDVQSGSGKLDVILQFPFNIKSDLRRKQAQQRKEEFETQLRDSKYGIVWVDGTEKITQLNRPAENNLMNQIQFLTTMLYGQLGVTEEIFNGTAEEVSLISYYNRTIEPILTAITDSFNRSFLTKTARTQGQRIIYIRNPFKLAPVEKLASMTDSFTRNAVLSSNEVRAIIGFKPSSDPEADELRNKNLNPPKDSGEENTPKKEEKDGKSNL